MSCWLPMVKKGRELSPLMRCRACWSSFVEIVFSANGMPRVASMERAEPQGAQLAPVYSVTGYWPTTLRNSKGSEAVEIPPAPPVLAAVTLALLAAGGG